MGYQHRSSVSPGRQPPVCFTGNVDRNERGSRRVGNREGAGGVGDIGKEERLHHSAEPEQRRGSFQIEVLSILYDARDPQPLERCLERQELELNGAATVARIAWVWRDGVPNFDVFLAQVACVQYHVFQDRNSIARDISSGHLEERDSTAVETPRAFWAKGRNSLSACEG